MVEPRRGISISDAAERLGVGVELLRKRAQRGTMPAYKVDRKWYVVLDVDRDGVQDIPPGSEDVLSRTVRSGTSGPGQDGSRGEAPAGVSPAARSQLGAIRDEWLAPLIAQIREQAEEIGRLRAERDAAAAERDRLRAERDSDRAFADRLVDLLQEERDAARVRVAELEAATGARAGAAAAPNGRGGGLPALWSRIRGRRR